MTEHLPREVEEDLVRLRGAGWRGRIDVELEDVSQFYTRIAVGAGWTCSTAWGAVRAPADLAYCPMVEGSGMPFSA
jgi:hypothetical protein